MQALVGALLLSGCLAGPAAVVAALTTRRGLAIAAIIVVLLVSFVVVSSIQGIGTANGHDTVAQSAGVFSPYTLVNGLQVYLFDSPTGMPTTPTGDGVGLLHVLAVLVVLLGSVGAMLWRYRKVGPDHHRARPRLALVRQRGRRQRRHHDHRPRRHRPARPQRRRQVHPHQHDGAASWRPRPARSPSTASRVWRNEQIYRHIGIVPEREAMYDFLTGREFVVANAELHGLPDPGAAAQAGARHGRDGVRAGPQDLHVLQGHAPAREDGVGAGPRAVGAAARRAVQRHGPAAAHAADGPAAADGRRRAAPCCSRSHILEEVEQLAWHIEVVVAGRHAASGDFRKIRRLMTDRPHRYLLRSSDDRALAAALIADPSVRGVLLRTEGGIEVEAQRLRPIQRAMKRVTSRRGGRELCWGSTVLTVGPLPHWLHIQRPAEPLC